MNCGRSSSVEWKLPKLQRRVRFPSPAPAPPGHAPGGFVMPTSHPPSTECGGQSAQHFPRASWGPRFRYKTHPARPTRHQSRYKTRPTRATRCQSRYKTRPARAARCHFRYKTHPARPKSPNLARFMYTGRILSRYHQQQDRHATSPGTKLAPHEPYGASPGTKLTLHAQNLPIWRVLLLLGEFYPVFVANKPSMASFLPHKHQHHHRHERNNTPTQHTEPRDERLSAHAPQTAPHNETFIAPARHKQPKFTHFHHAGANFLSQHTPHTHARATFLSTNASASKIDPNKTFIIFDSVITSRPDRKDIADGAPATTRRSSALDTAPMHQIAQHCTGN